MSMTPDLDDLASQTMASARSGGRRVVALAGPPASGKSTLADMLAHRLNRGGVLTQVVPMDGFHLDDRVLSARGLLHRKGAPETFDLAGFEALVQRLPARREVIYPIFDRTREIAIAGAGVLSAECDTVIVEGNYLLLDAPGWRDLARHWDLAIRVEAGFALLRARLLQRWAEHGLNTEQALAKAEGNDIPNAQLVLSRQLPAHIICRTTAEEADSPREKASR